MSQPVPDAAPQPSVFPVPAHVSSVLIAGGCGAYHIPMNGAVDCAVCYLRAQDFIFPPDPATGNVEEVVESVAAPAALTAVAAATTSKPSKASPAPVVDQPAPASS